MEFLIEVISDLVFNELANLISSKDLIDVVDSCFSELFLSSMIVVQSIYLIPMRVEFPQSIVIQINSPSEFIQIESIIGVADPITRQPSQCFPVYPFVVRIVEKLFVQEESDPIR
jgi:hypothetical protein